jgi:outer membrane receptor for ferrienterochelin and colicin
MRDEIGKLAVFSVGGACEARKLYDDYNNGANSIQQTRAQKTVKDLVAAFAADKISISEDSLLETLYQVGYDPYTEFLVMIWH